MIHFQNKYQNTLHCRPKNSLSGWFSLKGCCHEKQQATRSATAHQLGYGLWHINILKGSETLVALVISGDTTGNHDGTALVAHAC